MRCRAQVPAVSIVMVFPTGFKLLLGRYGADEILDVTRAGGAGGRGTTQRQILESKRGPLKLVRLRERMIIEVQGWGLQEVHWGSWRW